MAFSNHESSSNDVERSDTWLRAWTTSFLQTYQGADPPQRDVMRARLAALEKELLLRQMLRAPARQN